MLSLNSLHGTFCQNKLKKQWLEPTSWFVRNSRCIRLSEMNGLVVRTMGFTGCARLHSNKDANNHSRLCGQGCESRPFTGEGTSYRCRRSNSQRLFRWHPCQIPQMTLCSLPMVPYKGLQTNQNKRKMSELSSSLHTIQQSPPLTPPPPSNISKEKWVQCRIQPAPKSVT